LTGGGARELSYSTDGSSWSETILPSASPYYDALTEGNGLFVVGGVGGTFNPPPVYISRAPAGSTTLTLTDTTDLSSMVVGDTVVEVNGGADATGTITAITPGTPSITVAPPSTNWTGGVGATAKDTSRTVTTVNTPLESTNQISATGAASALWTQQTSSFGTDQINAVSYGNGKFVAVANNGKLATSFDGVAWTQQTSGLGTDSLSTVTYANNTFVAASLAGTLITSPNGTTWTPQTSSFGGSPIYSVIYGSSTFVAGGGSGKIATSINGTAWTQQTSGFGTSAVRAITFGNGLYVAGGADGKIATSSNATSWTQQTSSFLVTDQILGLAYGNGVYVAVGGTGKIATSPNGTAWTQQTSGFTGAMRSVTYGYGIFVATAAAGELATSPDGVTWTMQAPGFGADQIYGSGYGAGLYVAVGGNGKLATSTLPAGGTALTIAGADTDGFAVGNLISNGLTGASAATGVIGAINGTSVTVTPTSANWASGQNLYRGETIVNVVDSTDLTAYFVAQSLLTPSTTYQVRCRYGASSTGTESAWSNFASFTTASSFIPAIGGQLGGGYFAGQILDGSTVYNLIVAPIEGNTSGPAVGGALKGQYGGATPLSLSYKNTNSADLPADQDVVYGGTTSDRYKASADHPLFNTTWLNNATGPNGGTMNLATGGAGGGSGIGGYTDWYVPAKNELEVLYYYLKPNSTGSQPNNTSSGSNPNAVAPEPVSTNYTATNPAQTTVTAFQGSNAQAFSTANVYWSSSEYSSNTNAAWRQDFSDGGQNFNPKASSFYARAVRRIAA
jgi:hypothetical protein